VSTRPLPATYAEWLERAREQSQRFWSKTERSETGCLLWLAGKDKDGYGKFQITGRGKRFQGDSPVQKHVRAHKLAWELAHGPLGPGLVLRHTCDTPACCEIEHLLPGTQADNRRDCVARGREPRGEAKPLAVLTEELVREIRTLKLMGHTPTEISALLDAPQGAVYGAYHGRTWRHVA
jgi:hypothetical protein